MRGSDLSGEILDRRYQIVERIAEGAMGVVYRGMRLKLDRAVAIKVMHVALPDAFDARKRFEREAKLMARLEHPHCVSIIDYGISADKPYVVMELVRGRSLYEILEEHGRFEIPRAVDVVCQVLSGLAHAHDQGIVHRDIKPANIMITPTAPLGVHVRILDFGLARMLGGSTSLSNGVAVGTPSYMAPEQCRGEQVDARADIYACGVVLFEMLTGKKPFIASDPIAIVKKQVQDMPPLLAEIRPDDYGALEGVVARALAKSPADRYPSAIAMAEALDSARSGRGAPEATAVLPLIGASSVETIEPSIDIPITVGSSATLLAEPAEPAKEPAAEAAPEPAAETADASGSSSETADASGSSSQPAMPGSRIRYVVLGVVLLVAAAIIGMLASRLGGGEPAPADAPRAPAIVPAPVDAVADPATEIVSTASQLAATGKLEAAIDMLLKARQRFPDRAALPLVLGKLYFAKLWWNDGLSNLREALRLDPALRADPELLKTALHGFITTPGYDERLARFVTELGPAMIPLLQETAHSHPKSDIRTRCTTLLRKLHQR